MSSHGQLLVYPIAYTGRSVEWGACWLAVGRSWSVVLEDRVLNTIWKLILRVLLKVIH